MEVQLAPDLQVKLTHMAEQQGRDQAALITEAIERLVSYDARSNSKVENDPSWKQEEQLVATGAMTLPQEEMDWERFFSHPQTARISTEAAVQAVIDSRAIDDFCFLGRERLGAIVCSTGVERQPPSGDQISLGCRLVGNSGRDA